MLFPRFVLAPKILVFFLFLLLVVLAAGFYFYRFGPDVEKKTFFPCPVPEEHCRNSDNLSGLNAMGLNVPAGTEIKAVTDGTASSLRSSFKDNVIELRDPSGSAIFYIFQSD